MLAIVSVSVESIEPVVLDLKNSQKSLGFSFTKLANFEMY